MIYEDKTNTSIRPHNIIIEDRERISLSGVEDVDSFDDKQIVIITTKGSLTLRGTDLHIDKLNLETGEMSVTGILTDMGYEETAPGESLWSRLFK